MSVNRKKLATAKNRDINQPFLICINTNKKLISHTRVPKTHKKSVRRSSNISYVYKNKKALRVVKDINHSKFLHKFEYMFSTSANKNRLSFDIKYAKSRVDIIVEDKRGYFQDNGSKILRLGKKNIKKLR